MQMGMFLFTLLSIYQQEQFWSRPNFQMDAGFRSTGIIGWHSVYLMGYGLIKRRWLFESLIQTMHPHFILLVIKPNQWERESVLPRGTEPDKDPNLYCYWVYRSVQAFQSLEILFGLQLLTVWVSIISVSGQRWFFDCRRNRDHNSSWTGFSVRPYQECK